MGTPHSPNMNVVRARVRRILGKGSWTNPTSIRREAAGTGKKGLTLVTSVRSHHLNTETLCCEVMGFIFVTQGF